MENRVSQGFLILLMALIISVMCNFALAITAVMYYIKSENTTDQMRNQVNAAKDQRRAVTARFHQVEFQRQLYKHMIGVGPSRTQAEINVILPQSGEEMESIWADFESDMEMFGPHFESKRIRPGFVSKRNYRVLTTFLAQTIHERNQQIVTLQAALKKKE